MPPAFELLEDLGQLVGETVEHMALGFELWALSFHIL
jgi:hypothetical protein